MKIKLGDIQKFEVFPLTLARWNDLEQLFGPNGACAGCWCMWFRMTHKEFTKSGKEEHKKALHTTVQGGKEPGLIIYADGVPAGWVAVAPRSEYPRLETSTILAAVDDQEVWSIPCFFIHRNYRRIGLMDKLIVAVVEHARAHGVKILEAYPNEGTEKMTALTIFTGVSSAFIRAGFVEVARRSEHRPVMRLVVQ